MGTFLEDINVIELSPTPTPANKKRKVFQMAEWSTAAINDLPDSSFLYIAPGGKKDDEGKTTPRSLRHFPVKDAQGKVDLPHVRNALARIPQSNVPENAKNKARAKAQRLLEEAKDMKTDLEKAIKGLSEEHQKAIKEAIEKTAADKKAAEEGQASLAETVKKSIEALDGDKPNLKAALEPLAKSAEVDLPDLPGFQEGVAPTPEVPDDLKPQWEAMQKAQRDQAAELAELKKSARDKVFLEKAAAFDKVPGCSTEEMGDLLEKNDTAGCGEMLEGVLKATQAAIEKAGMFSEQGFTGNGAGNDRESKIEELAKSFMAKSSDPMTKAQAIRQVLRDHPELRQ